MLGILCFPLCFDLLLTRYPNMYEVVWSLTSIVHKFEGKSIKFFFIWKFLKLSLVLKCHFIFLDLVWSLSWYLIVLEENHFKFLVMSEFLRLNLVLKCKFMFGFNLIIKLVINNIAMKINSNSWSHKNFWGTGIISIHYHIFCFCFII